MKTFSLEANNPILMALMEMIADGAVIITSGNKPVCAVMQVDEADLQTWQLGENPQFLAVMQRSWERLHREEAVPLAEAWQRLLAE
jgi:hypothetical protein